MTEQQIEQALIEKLGELKYTYRPDIHDRAALEVNFRQHFDALNRVQLTDSEFARLLDGIVTPDVFTAAKHLREKNSFERDDGTPLYYTLVNIKDWCKNNFEVVNQLRINTDYSHHRFDVILLINGVPVVQIELKTLQISPRKAMQQSSTTRTTPAMATPRPCSVSSSCSSSATAAIPGTSPITTAATSASMPMSAFCRFISSQALTTKRSPIWTASPTLSWPNARWAR